MQVNQNVPYKGMSLDSGLGVEPLVNTTTFVLNGRLMSDEGDQVNYQNEPGNVIHVTLPGGVATEERIIVGHINLDRGRTFLATKSERSDEYAILEEDGTYTPLIQNSCLNLDPHWPVRGWFRTVNGCETEVYINDWVNPDRIINIDQLDHYKNESGGWDCDRMVWDPFVVPPCVHAEYIRSGYIDKGQYRFAVELLDKENNSIRYSPLSEPVFIWDRGSARINVSNVDDIATYIRLWVVQYNTGSGEPNVYSIEELYTVDNLEEIIFTGINSDSDVVENINTIINPPPVYEASKVTEKVDDRAVRANLRERFVDYSDYQKSASKICTRYIVDIVDPNEVDAVLTFMGDEIYDIGIVYVHEWGVTSPEWHIPGRPKDTYCWNGQDDGNSGEDNNDVLKINIIGAIPVDCVGYVTYEVVVSNGSTTETYTGVMWANDPILPVEIVLDGTGWFITSESYTNTVISGLCGDMEGVAFVNTPGGSGISTPLDSQSITTWSPDLQFLGIDSQEQLNDYIAENGQLEYWQVYNTANPISDSEGYMGYYECRNATYDSDLFSCVEDYWGVDCCGNDLNNQPVRHHRFPDRTTVPLQTTNTKVRRLGLKFSNIVYPDSTIIGHYFVYRKRSANTKTVIDKGVLGAVRTGSDGEVFVYMDSDNNTQWNYLWTPKTMDGSLSQGDYLKAESARTITERLNNPDDYEKRYNAAIGNKDFYIGTRVLRYEQEGKPSWTNYNILEERVLQQGQQKTQVQGDELTNLSLSNFVNFVKTPEGLNTDRDTLHYVSVKQYKPNIYCDLFSGEYVKAHSCMKTTGEEEGFYTFGGDTFITEFRVANATLRQVRDGIRDDLLIIWGIVVSTILTVVTAGAASPSIAAAIAAGGTAGALIAGAIISGALGVAQQLVRVLMDVIADDGAYEAYRDNTNGDFDGGGLGQLGSNWMYYAGEFLDRWYIESDTNYSLARQANEFICGGSPRNVLPDVGEDVIGYFYERIAYFDEPDDRFYPKPVPCPEVYFYNDDMTYHAEDMILHIPLPATYNFCTACANEYPNMIIWSQKAFQNQASNAMRLFLANDFTHVGEDTGEITMIHYSANRLKIRTEQSFYIQSPNPRIINTDQDTAYIGSGDFFSIPEMELVKVDYGYGGSSSRFDWINTEFGLFSVDVDAGRVFLIAPNGQPEEISLQEAQQWSRINIPLQLPKQVKEIFGVDYKCKDSTIFEYGVGYISAYDHRFKRVIFHKTDFRIIKTDGLEYNAETGEFNIPFTNKEYFENLSFTLSYNVLYKLWESFFSYQPQYMWGNYEGIFTTAFDNNIYKHTENNFGEFYGNVYPFIIEFEHTDQVHYIVNLFEYYSQTFNYDGVSRRWVEKSSPTFDHMMIYTEKQSTGLQELEYRDGNVDPWGRVPYNGTIKEVIRTSDSYRVNMIKDIATTNPIITEDWTQRQSEYNGRQGYIDIVANNNNINYNASQWDLIELRDRYHIARMFFSNDGEHKLVVDHINTIFTRKQL